MPEVNYTHTEINPTYDYGYGGGKRELTNTEVNPSFLGGGGGGWRIFTATESSPTFKTPKPGTMGLNRGFDFRGMGFRI